MMHKRIFALVVAFCLASSMGVAAKEFKSLTQNVENVSLETKSYDEAIEVLTSLELINRADDKEYNKNDTMSRGEFVNILARMLVLNDSVSLNDQTIPFLDVDNNTLYVSSIIYAYKLGIISGGYDGRFKPDQSIKFEEALKMLVTTIGYNLRAEKKGGYPTGYLLFAKEKGITKGIDVAVGQEINKGIIAQLILNTLDVNLMQMESFSENDEEYVEIDGETLLSENLRVKKDEGIVKATSITRLTGESNLEDNQVQIDKNLYKVGKTNAWNLLGYNVTYYAREIDGEFELLFIAPNSKNTVLTVNSDNIVSDSSKFTKTNLVYQDENEKKCNFKISPYAYVIYNGKALSDYTKKDINPSSGELTLIDNNRDNLADVVLVLEWKNLVVGNMVSSSKSVYDKSDPEKYVGLDPESELYDFCLTKSGKSISFNEVAAGNVVSYAVSRNITGRKFVYARVSDSNVYGYVTGKITEESNYYITIDEKSYVIAKDFSHEFSNIKLGDRGVFYLDIYGKIAGFEKYATDSEMYGFLLSYGCYRKGMQKVNQFKIYTLNGEIDIIDTAEKFYLDGKKIKVSDLELSDPNNPNEVESVLLAQVDATINVFDPATGDSAVDPSSYADTARFNQVIRYRLNYEGKIDKIDTKAPDDDDDSLSYDVNRENGAVGRYYVQQQATFGLNKVDFMIDNNTLLLVVPDISKRDDAANYYVSTAKEYFIGSNSYKVEAYDLSDTMNAGLLVMYGNSNGFSINADTGITLVDKVMMSRNENDEFVGKLYGITGGKYVEKFAVDDTILNGLKQGDIVRISENAKGEINDIKLCLHPSDSPKLLEDGTLTGRYYNQFRLVYGVLCKKVGDVITVSRNIADASNPDTYSGSEDYYNVNGFNVWIYNKEEKSITKGSGADINDYVYQNNPNAKIAVYTRYGAPGTIVIMKLD